MQSECEHREHAVSEMTPVLYLHGGGGGHKVLDEQRWRIWNRREIRNSSLSAFSLSWQLDLRALRRA